LETLGVLENGTDGAKTDSFKAIFATLSEVKKDVYALDVQEMAFRPLVSKDSARKTVQNGKKEGASVTSLLDL